MSKHTPGPWGFTDLNSYTKEADPYYIFIEPDVAVIEKKIEGHNSNDWHDARLIAAAPDLLAALQEVQRQLTNLQPIIANGLLEPRQLAFIDPHIEMCMTVTNEAIAKATGEKP